MLSVRSNRPLLQKGSDDQPLFGSQLLVASISFSVLPGRNSETAFNDCREVRDIFPSATKVQLWLRATRRWQVYHFARLFGEVVRLQHRLTHCIPFHKKQKTRLLCLMEYVKAHFLDTLCKGFGNDSRESRNEVHNLCVTAKRAKRSRFEPTFYLLSSCLSGKTKRKLWQNYMRTACPLTIVISRRGVASIAAARDI